MLSRSRRLVVALVVVLAVSSSSLSAAPRNDDDNPFIHRFEQLVTYVKHLFHVGPTDDPVLPKP